MTYHFEAMMLVNMVKNMASQGMFHLNQFLTSDEIDFLKVLGIDNQYWLRVFRIIFLLLAIYVATLLILRVIERQSRLEFLKSKETLLSFDAKRVETLATVFRNTVMAVAVVSGITVFLSEIGINLAPLVAGASIAGVAVGFGAQNIVKDLFYGFFILLENQFGIGDVIKLDDVTGTVERLTLRTVTLRDNDGRVHILPNSEACKVIVYTHGWSTLNLPLEVLYQTNLDEAFCAIDRVNKEVQSKFKTILLEGPTNLGVTEFGPRGITLMITAKTQPNKHWELSRYYRKAIKEAFDDAGIGIPVTEPLSSSLSSK